jgi:hypothetical protein
MNVAYISTLSALAGSAVGGLTSGFTTWLSQRAQARAGLPPYPLSISALMKSVKLSSTNALGSRRRESGELWQDRFLTPRRIL